MDTYKLTVGVESTDDYKKAKQDLIEALNSFNKLTPQEKECLMKEFFGAANVAMMCRVLQQVGMR